MQTRHSESVAVNVVDGVTVSTVRLVSKFYQTVLHYIDGKSIAVASYDTELEARKGHFLIISNLESHLPKR